MYVDPYQLSGITWSYGKRTIITRIPVCDAVYVSLDARRVKMYFLRQFKLCETRTNCIFGR